MSEASFGTLDFGLKRIVAEGEGFEPPSPFGRQFSRLVQ